jgi:23S rRNA (pseudouridine1915-N3)-methyltransferase
MKMVLMLTGKTRPGFVEAGMEEYLKRIGKYAKLDVGVIPDVRSAGKLGMKQVIQKEGDEILKRLDSRDVVVLLDERGRELSSLELAEFIGQQQAGGGGRLVFVIGGASGCSVEVRTRSDFIISLSRMTFSHQIVRIIFLEQLYRAFTILNNEPYHLAH